MKGAAGGRPSARTGGQPTAAADRQRPAAPRDSAPQAANLAPSAHQYACRCIQLNVRGMLASKSRAPAPPPCLDLIRDLNSTGKNLALLSETWGDPAAPLPGWTCISRPRPTDPKHGGVAILVRNDIAATEILTDRTANGLATAPPAPRCVLSLPSTAAMLRSPSRCSLAPLLGREVCASPSRTPLPPLCGSAAAPCSCPRPWC